MNSRVSGQCSYTIPVCWEFRFTGVGCWKLCAMSFLYECTLNVANSTPKRGQPIEHPCKFIISHENI